jgi:hypothetical protein
MSKQFKGFDKDWLEKQSANKVWGNNFGDLSNKELEALKTKGLVKNKTLSNTAKKASKQQPEYALQKQVCAYLRAVYPNVLFMSDTIAATRLTIPQQVRNKAIQKTDFHCPDLLIFKKNSIYSGCFLELKAKDIYRKDEVTLLSNPHVEAQKRTIDELLSNGYFAAFAVGFEQAKNLIDHYMKIDKNTTTIYLTTNAFTKGA